MNKQITGKIKVFSIALSLEYCLLFAQEAPVPAYRLRVARFRLPRSETLLAGPRNSGRIPCAARARPG